MAVNFPLERSGRLLFKVPMNPFRHDEPKVKVERRAVSVNLELVLIAGLVVLLIGAVSGL